MKTKKPPLFLFTFLLFALFGCGFEQETDLITFGPTFTDWWDTGWAARRRLTVDNSGQGDLTDFPVLVLLNGGRVDYGLTRNSGEDIRFIDGDGTVLPHEIERWDESGESVVWVKVPQIDGNSSSDFIWMYYGNPGASDAQQTSEVWETNYVLVWHLGDAPTSAVGDNDIVNSTDNFAGSDTGEGTSQNMGGANQVAGIAGLGLSFDGTNEWIEPLSPLPGFFHDELFNKTFTAWIRTDNTGLTQTVYEEGGTTNGFYVGVVSNQVRLATRDSSSQVNAVYPYTDTGSFHYVAAVFDNGQLSIQLDDNPPVTAGAGYATIGTHSGEPGVGQTPDSDAAGTSTSNRFTGDMDEIRISDIARSVDWIAAEYLSVSDGFITFGSEQIYR